MATSSNRDVKMTLSVETLGDDGIKTLKDSVAALAKQGGDATPEFQRLADEIGRLADQSQALAAFQALSDQTAELTAKQDAAAASVVELQAKLQAATAVTRAAADAQQSTVDALQAARAAQKATRDELAVLIATTDQAGKSEQAYADTVQRLRLAKIAQRAEVERLSDALKVSNKDVADAEVAETKLEGAYKRAEKAAASVQTAIVGQQEALRASAAAADALGVSTENLAEAQAGMAQGFNELQGRADNLTGRLAKLAQQERDLLDIRAFQQQADDAKHLFDTASYAELFEQALSNLAKAEREVALAQAAVDWQREAEAIVNAAEASQRLAREQEAMLEVRRELENDSLMRQQAAEADRLAETARVVSALTAQLDNLEREEREAGEAAAAAGKKITDAFGAVGVRSVEALRTEITQIRAAMDTLRNTAGVTGGALTQAFASGEAKIRALELQIRSVTGELTLADRASVLFKNSLGQIAAGNVIADAVGYLVNKVKELGREFIDVTVQTERLRKGLEAIYKDSTVAAAQFGVLRTVAQASGLSITALSDSFLRFSAATASAGINLKVSNDLFSAVTRAGATLGLSNDAVSGTLDALGQMASKGTVSMEELRQQLGDRLPGALGLAATGLGITQQQLIKLVETGGLAAEEFFPAFTAGLKTMAGDTDTLTGAYTRFTNALTVGAQNLGDAGGLNILKLAVQGLAIAFGVIAVPLAGFVEALNLAARGAYVFFQAISGNATGATFIEFGKQVDASASRMGILTNALDAAVFGQQAQTSAVSQGATAMQSSVGAILNTAVAQERLATTLGATGNAYIQQLVKMAENSVATTAAIASSEKLQKAKEDENRALVQTAQLTGDAAKALDAQAAAARSNTTASEGVATARAREVAATQASIATIQEEGVRRGALSDAMKKQITDLQTKLVVQTAEVEKSRQSTDELGAQAVAARTAAAAYADNSTQITAFFQAMQNSQQIAAVFSRSVQEQTAQLDSFKTALDLGLVSQTTYDAAKERLRLTTEQLNRYTQDAASSEKLYRDAVADSIAALDQKSRAASASIGVAEAQAKAEQSHYEVLARVAQAQGNGVLATEFAISAKYKEIEAVRLAAQIKTLELDADRAAIEIQIAALDPQDKLYQQKRIELDIRLQLIKAKQIEAGASADVIRGIEGEIDALRNSTNARSGSTGAIDRDTASRYKNIDAINAQRSALTSDGLKTNKDGSAAGTFTNTLPIDKASTVLLNGSNSYGAGDVDYLKEAKAQAVSAVQFLDSMKKVSAGSVSLRASSDATALLTATSNALSRAEGLAAAGVVASGTSAAAAQSTTHTVNIQLPDGSGGSVNVASAQDASNLSAILQQLGNAKKVS